ncbi:MAG: hypothetical protein IRZ16_06760 [Myxococcaceae bacterium]|nr:hypothetical protein [Myxococcaceae bacterium]
MRPFRAALRLSSAAFGAAAVIVSVGCVKEISSEERLERETARVPVEKAAGAAELDKINCQDATAQLNKARNVNRPETERLQDYIDLYKDLVKKTATFDEAMARNPDLQYQEGSQKYAEARDICVQQAADVRVEFERYVREIVNLPTVQEIKGGNTVEVPRLDFNTLRAAIETLDDEDKEQLLARVDNAEKRVASNKEEAPRRKHRGD